MPEGVITGGWSYVIAAYLISTAVLVAYTWSLLRRERRESQRGRDDE
jgi:lipopolysaccharide export LptBFGC system permease protein LptF